MIPSKRNPRLHLLSGLAFLVAGVLFLMLSFTTPNAHRLGDLPVGMALLLAAFLQILAYRKKGRA
ncbi:MAG TPA: hypothetical protein VJ600_07470 [Holophagaceae bacterium]|nr:hypothetical protein [Holophagaceae bacterium]